MEINKKRVISELARKKSSAPSESSKPTNPEIPTPGTPEYAAYAEKMRQSRIAGADALLSRDKAKRAEKVEELRKKMVAAGRDPDKMKDVPVRELPWRLAVTAEQKPFMTLAKKPKTPFRDLMGRIVNAVTGTARKVTTALASDYDVRDMGGSTETRGEAIRLAGKKKKK
jgi:hypothetical protein